MKIKVEVDTETLKRLAIDHILSKFQAGDVEISPNDIIIQVKSKQNFREREWETGEFRAVLEKDI
jgi:hypothetical protein